MNEPEIREFIIEYAKSYYGHFYLWGGDDPSGFDCSGFVIEVYKSVGLLPRSGDWTAEILSGRFRRISREFINPGDLVFWQNKSGNIIHVEICLNDFLSIGASGGGSETKSIEDAIKMNAFIKPRPMNSRSGIWGFESPF